MSVTITLAIPNVSEYHELIHFRNALFQEERPMDAEFRSRCLRGLWTRDVDILLHCDMVLV